MDRVVALLRPTRATTIVLVGVVAAIAIALLVAIPPAGQRDGAAAGSRAQDDVSASSSDPAIGTVGGTSAPEAIDVGPGAASSANKESLAGTADMAVAPDSAAAAPAASTLAPPSLDQRLVRMGSVELRTSRAAFDDAWSDVQHVATGNGGYVLATSRSGAGRGARVATVSMRVPSARFQDALDDLRGLDDVTVRGLDVSSQDVTEEYVDTRSRLRHDRAVEARLLSLLAETDGVSEVLAVQARLDQVQEQIEVAKGRLQYLDKVTTMSTIDVALRAPGTAASDRDPEAGALGAAWRDAVDRFTANVAAVIVWLGGALPALVLLAIGVVAVRLVWRRHAARTGERRAPEE